MRAKTFRSDLYYRLNVVTIWLPPLRERGDDMIELAQFFAVRSAKQHGRSKPTLSPELLELMRQYPWPGNVRELENVLERAVILSSRSTIEPPALPPEILGYEAGPTALPTRGAATVINGSGLRDSVEQYEKALILRALDEHAGIQTCAAEALRISESNLRYKMRKYGLHR